MEVKTNLIPTNSYQTQNKNLKETDKEPVDKVVIGGNTGKDETLMKLKKMKHGDTIAGLGIPLVTIGAIALAAPLITLLQGVGLTALGAIIGVSLMAGAVVLMEKGFPDCSSRR